MMVRVRGYQIARRSELEVVVVMHRYCGQCPEYTEGDTSVKMNALRNKRS